MTHLGLEVSLSSFYLFNGVLRLPLDTISPQQLINTSDEVKSEYSMRRVKLWAQKKVLIIEALFSLS